MKPARLSLLALPLAAAGLAALALLPAGCGGPEDTAQLQKQLQELRAEVRQTRADRDRFADRLDQAERTLAGVQRDLAAVRNTAVEARTEVSTALAAVPGPSGEVAAAAGAALGLDPEGLARVLSTEAGQEAVAGALDAVEAKRREVRREAMLGRMMASFAERANLTADQQERMTTIVGRTFEEMRGVWSGMRGGAAADLAPEARAALREENVRKMEEIRTRADAEVKAVLSSSQYEIYQQDAERMRNAFRGGPGGGFGPPGGGGGGGRGGRRDLGR